MKKSPEDLSLPEIQALAFQYDVLLTSGNLALQDFLANIERRKVLVTEALIQGGGNDEALRVVLAQLRAIQDRPLELKRRQQRLEAMAGMNPRR